MGTFFSVIQNMYGSLDAPNFSFVERKLGSKPYRNLCSQLAEKYDIEDITEPNDDVCFGYLVSTDNGRFVLELSMLGKYAVLLETKGQLLTYEEMQRCLPDIYSLVTNEGFVFLSQDTLEQPVPINLSNSDLGDTKLYNALFSDISGVPWQTDSSS